MMTTNRNHKKHWICIVSLLFVLGLTGCQSEIENIEKMTLRSESLTIEYGNSIPVLVHDYLDNTEQFLKDVDIKNIPENEKDKTYPAVGSYEVILKKDNQEEKVKVIIRDTIAPTFKNLKEKYEVAYGTKLSMKGIQTEDLSKVTVTYNDSTVNYQKEGNYKAKIIAIDFSQNKTEKEVTIHVNAKKISSSGNKSTSQKKMPSSDQSSNKKPSSNNPQQKEPQKNLIEQLHVAKSYSKVFIVSSKSYSARQGKFTYYHKVNGSWKKEFEIPAVLGEAGMGRASESSTKTPTGQYTFTKLMGIYSNPGTKMSYHQIDKNDYWCGEAHYNQFIDEDNHSHECSKTNDEHLIDYPTTYQYAAAFNYNSNNVKGKGFAFFLHCSNNISYTGGCIAIQKSYMKKVMQQIDGNTVMIIDLEKNISQY